MYRTLLVGVWLSSGRSNVKVPHLALQGVSTEFVLIETHREGNVPHVARVAQRNYRYIYLFNILMYAISAEPHALEQRAVHCQCAGYKLLTTLTYSFLGKENDLSSYIEC